MVIPFFLLLWSLMVIRLSAKLIDLSQNHGPDTIMSPGNPHFTRSTVFAGDYVPGVFVEGGQYFTGEHGGTHMDGPAHFQRGGQRIHEIPLENTIADGVMIDCSKEASENNNFSVPIKKLLTWEKKYGQIPRDAAVIFNFGWSCRFSNRKLYLGSESDDKFTFVFPFVSAEAGLWLYEERNIKIIGTDTLSPDNFIKEGNTFPIHRKYLPNNRLIVENLNGTEQLPPRGFRFLAAPVKFVGNTGTQVRAFAMTYD